jgi:hypothetical protein
VAPLIKDAIRLRLLGDTNIADPALAKMLMCWRDDERGEDLWRKLAAAQGDRLQIDLNVTGGRTTLQPDRFLEFVIGAWRAAVLHGDVTALRRKRDAALERFQRKLGELAKAKMTLVELAEALAKLSARLNKVRADIMPKPTGQGRATFQHAVGDLVHDVTGKYLNREVGVLTGIVFNLGKDIDPDTVRMARERRSDD